MSFLSRKPARPEGRGRDDGYDGYDDYAPDDYQNEDDRWSPGEYFSPEGIKGRWAGEKPEGRAGGRGRHGNARPESGPGYDSYSDDFNSTEYGGAGYGGDELTSGAYDLPDGADEDRAGNRRRRRDREDRTERTGILRLRRDRGEDIWPDDGISDEDYWASVAADRPLNGTDLPPGSAPGAGGPGYRPGADARPGTGGPDPRFGGEQRGGPGRLGPPPGLASDYRPGGTGRTGSGPMPARPGTGPQPARSGTGPTPAVGVTSSRPPAGRSGMRPGQAQPGSAPSGFTQPAPRPSFQPNGYQAGSGPSGSAPSADGPTASRQQDRGDWGDRTERIERVPASGYPDPRPSGRGQAPGGPRTSGGLGPVPGFGSAPAAAPGHPAASGRTRGDTGRADTGRADHAARQAPDRREADRRDSGRETSGGWPAHARGSAPARPGADDDPLTSKAYSRSAQADTDGRSYRAAARRSQAQAKLTESAEAFISGQYPPPGQYQTGHTGDYWQYRDDSPAPAAQPAPGRHAPGGQAGQQAQPGRSQAPPGQAQGSGQGGQPGRNTARPAPGLPPAGSPAGTQYDAQQPRPAQQQHQQAQQHRQPSQAQLPADGPASARPAVGGLNPYDTTSSSSYPYPPGQAYPARPAPAAPAQDSTDDRYYRPSPPADGSTGSTSHDRTDQGRTGHGNTTGDRRYP